VGEKEKHEGKTCPLRVSWKKVGLNREGGVGRGGKVQNPSRKAAVDNSHQNILTLNERLNSDYLKKNKNGQILHITGGREK